MSNLTYQSFDTDAKGDSRSADKLAALGLPHSLAGLSVLDLGCNAGFFCLEAKRRGAARVLGMDHDNAVLGRARQMAEENGLEVEYVRGDLQALPEERFDYVLLLSVLHYIEDPARLLQGILGRLKRGGTLVLETGVAGGAGSRAVGRALRSIDERFFPSRELLERVWLKGYSVRRYGPSVAQAGDPMPRYVFHCTQLKTNVVFVVGDGGIGKSTLAAQWPAPLISTDELFHPARATPHRVPPEQKMYDQAVAETQSIWAAWDKLKHRPEIRAYFATVISKAVRHSAGADQVVVEGFVVTDLIAEIEAKLGPDFQCWRVARTG